MKYWKIFIPERGRWNGVCFSLLHLVSKAIKISKFTKWYLIKTECDEVWMANKCLAIFGVLMYSFRYQPRMKTFASNITKFCFRCYAYNEHLMIKCTTPRDYKTCSESSSTNDTANYSQRSASNAPETTRHCLFNVPEWKWHNNSNMKEKVVCSVLLPPQ